jgi:hypothetical protein
MIATLFFNLMLSSPFHGWISVADLPVKAQALTHKPALNTEQRQPVIDGNDGAADKLRCPGDKPDHGKAA